MRQADLKPRVQATLRAGDYTFSPVAEIRVDGEVREVWSAQDALVLKAMALVLGDHLTPSLSPHCFHVAGRGGAKGAVRAVATHLTMTLHVLRSDVHGYYAGIDHMILCNLLQRVVDRVFRLYEQGADWCRIGAYIRRWLLWAGAGVRQWLLSPLFCLPARERPWGGGCWA